jgi:PKD repeat protein
MSLVRLSTVALCCLLLPGLASAAVWGGFDSTRVNYAGGILASGADHSTFRARLSSNGDVVAPSTSTLTTTYLATVDVFYTSLSNLSAPVLSSQEQAALAAWVAGGGVFIISGDIFNTALYDSEGAPFGIGGFVDVGSIAATSTGTSHPLMTNVTTLEGVTHVTWTSPTNGLVLAASGANRFVEVFDASTGFTGGGAVLVLGDHNFLTNSGVGNAQNLTFLDNMIAWASSGGPAANNPPSADAGGPYAGTRNVPIALDGTGSGDIDGTISSYAWDCENDGVVDVTAGAGTGNACTYPAVGTYTVSLTVTDDDGATATATASVSVGNDPPVADAGGPYAGSEGVGITLDASGSSDPGGAIVTYAWDCDNDGVDDVTSGSPSAICTYADDGTFTASLTVVDDDGASATASTTVVVSNVPPVVVSVSVPGGAEGQTLTFAASATDVAGDPLSYSWNFGDGTGAAGASVTHSYADDGSYTVTVTVNDGDAGFASGGGTAVITNVAPSITSTPPTVAQQGVSYTYAPAVSDPGAEVFVWSLAPGASANTQLDPSTGAISWTPDSADTAQGSFALSLSVFDGDGGSDTQGWTVTITAADSDGDGMPDDWEGANGLNAGDPSDAGGDPDADGLSNLDEYLGGTDPFSYDGPSVPALVAPVAGVDVVDAEPLLVLTNSTDPQGEPLTYTFEVYEDAALTVFVTAMTSVPEGAGGETSWEVDVTLTENARYWWRAAASDASVTSPYSSAESFVVNLVEEAPPVPVLVFPVGGETATSLTPTLSWSESADPDGDVVTYAVEVYDEGGQLVTSASGVSGDGVVGEWSLDVALAEDAAYTWTVQATDGALSSAWADPEGFVVSTDNAAPSLVVFLDPVDGGAEVNLSPPMVATEGIDPEGTAVSHLFELDAVATFDSADYVSETVLGDGSGEVIWSLEDAGIVLPENQVAYARVRGIDEDGVSTAPDVIAFLVRGVNEPPETPRLLAPDDGSAGGPQPTLVASLATDPEGDEVQIEFVVTRDEELTDVVAGSGLLDLGGDNVSWTVPVPLSGDLYWSARAADPLGAESEWASPWTYSVAAPGDDDDAAGDDDDATGGCACQSSLGGWQGGSATWLLVPVLALLHRRRR